MWKHIIFLSVFIFYASNNSVKCARILGVVPSASFSHQIVFRPIWRELAKRGHDMVVITTDPENDPTSNVTEIDISFAYHLWNNQLEFMKKFEANQNNPYQLIKMVREVSIDMCTEELLHPEIQMLLKNETEHFDLVIVEYFYPVMLGFAERFKCPYIGVTPFDMPNFFLTEHGISVHPVAYPDILLPFQGGKMNFWERLMSTLFNVFMRLNTYTIGYEKEDAFLRKHFGKDVPSIDRIMKNSSMIFLNVNPAFNVRPLGPAFVNIGDGIHIAPVQPLPQDLKEFMDNSTNGVIYFSFGTNIKSDRIPSKLRRIFLDTFKDLSYNILWKFNKSDLPHVPGNVKIVEWVPQQDLLRHPNVKLFITQGGLQSTEEAIFSHVPMIGIPFFADQYSNVQKLVKKGFGVYLNKNEITKDKLKHRILTVITNSKYVDRIKEVAELTKDQPMTGLEKAVWWTEYVIRHKGAPHFKNPMIDLPTYQAYLLDVIVFILLAVIIFIYIIFKLSKFLSRTIKNCIINNNTKLKTS